MTFELINLHGGCSLELSLLVGSSAIVGGTTSALLTETCFVEVPNLLKE